MGAPIKEAIPAHNMQTAIAMPQKIWMPFRTRLLVGSVFPDPGFDFRNWNREKKMNEMNKVAAAI